MLRRPWALPLLRDVGIYRIRRFNELLRHNQSLTPRTLSRRLHELSRAGLVRRTIFIQDPLKLEWDLTPKGEDLLPALEALARFGTKHFGYTLFEDARPRELRSLDALRAATRWSNSDARLGHESGQVSPSDR